MNVTPPKVMIDSIPLHEVETQKYYKLNWLSYVSILCSRMSFYLFWINSHRRTLPSTVCKMLIDSLVLSRLMYALPVWGPMLSKSQTICLQHAHNRVTRITANLRRSDHLTHHRRKLNWLSVPSSVKHCSLCAMNNIYINKNHNVFNPSIIHLDNITFITQDLHPPVFCHLASTNTKTLFQHTVLHW